MTRWQKRVRFAIAMLALGFAAVVVFALKKRDTQPAPAAAVRTDPSAIVEVTGGPIGGPLSIAQLADGFGRFCERAAPSGLLLHIEYFPFSGIVDLATAREVARVANQPNGGVLVDTWHHERGPDAGELGRLTDAATSVLGIQLNDAAVVAEDDVRHECMHARVLPGDGLATSAGMIAALRSGGCVAPVGVEVYSDELQAMDPREAALAARRAAERVLATVA